MYGPSEDVDADASLRRTVYSRVSRSRLSKLFRLYDFPDPSQTAPGRDLTISSLQQLFIMNSSFMKEEATVLAKSVEPEPDNAAKMRSLYRKILSRDPSPKELDLALSYLSQGTLEQYSHILLSTNEVIFWP
jgi:hypothetical protein